MRIERTQLQTGCRSHLQHSWIQMETRRCCKVRWVAAATGMTCVFCLSARLWLWLAHGIERVFADDMRCIRFEFYQVSQASPVKQALSEYLFSRFGVSTRPAESTLSTATRRLAGWQLTGEADVAHCRGAMRPFWRDFDRFAVEHRCLPVVSDLICYPTVSVD